MNRTILITGGAGFIGSNYIEYHLKNNKKDKIVNYDLLTYAGSLNNTESFQNNPRYNFEKGDICNSENLLKVFKKYKISDIIHFAAESHVDNSINGPDAFIKTNILGTHTLLQIALEQWQNNNTLKTSRFHHISTDEVYGSLGEKGYFTEKSQYQPNSPYSASKASSDMLVRSYHKTYNLNTVITNCSNNYGPNQHSEKLIPKIINNILNNKIIPIYGDGNNIRDWLFVEDHCSAIFTTFNKGEVGEVYNIGGDHEITNLELTNIICEKMSLTLKKEKDYFKPLITHVKDRLGHDYRYAIDTTKISKELGWSSKYTFEEGISKTILSYIR
ncbi:dTDP-glucose 4,6-dehydratase [Halobacteriovorax sp. XZX-3]|uniref:dTDP-glucose 4,6-dehydratase n=1 Tax=unclassified Halobacteriovorax TaxID=2639665 RepID=UPI0037156641